MCSVIVYVSVYAMFLWYVFGSSFLFFCYAMYSALSSLFIGDMALYKSNTLLFLLLYRAYRSFLGKLPLDAILFFSWGLVVVFCKGRGR